MSDKGKLKENLGDELCEYCPLEPEDRGVKCYGGAVAMCEGARCDDAFENYLEETGSTL